MSSTRPLTAINEIIIHCAATPNGKWFAAKDIDQWHAQRGFSRSSKFSQYSPLKHIGYHFVIGLKGGVEQGRDMGETGAHCLGHNSRSIGICMVGTDSFTQAQWQSLRELVKIQLGRIPNAKVLGHRDTSPDTNHNGRADPQEWLKICPGFSVADWLKGEMRPLVEHLILDD